MRSDSRSANYKSLSNFSFPPQGAQRRLVDLLFAGRITWWAIEASNASWSPLFRARYAICRARRIGWKHNLYIRSASQSFYTPVFTPLPTLHADQCRIGRWEKFIMWVADKKNAVHIDIYFSRLGRPRPEKLMHLTFSYRR